MKNIRKGIYLIAVGMVVAGMLSCTNEKQQDASEAESEIRDIVTQFGETLKHVSLLSPDAAKQMQQHYSPYIAEKLLTKWMGNPKNAPGRITSSPWPEKIEVTEIEKKNPQTYSVRGRVILMTSAEKTSEADDNAGLQPVQLTIEKTAGDWQITFWEEATLN